MVVQVNLALGDADNLESFLNPRPILRSSREWFEWIVNIKWNDDCEATIGFWADSIVCLTSLNASRYEASIAVSSGSGTMGTTKFFWQNLISWVWNSYKLRINKKFFKLLLISLFISLIMLLLLLFILILLITTYF